MSAPINVRDLRAWHLGRAPGRRLGRDVTTRETGCGCFARAYLISPAPNPAAGLGPGRDESLPRNVVALGPAPAGGLGLRWTRGRCA